MDQEPRQRPGAMAISSHLRSLADRKNPHIHRPFFWAVCFMRRAPGLLSSYPHEPSLTRIESPAE